jgi:hypothetical protein
MDVKRLLVLSLPFAMVGVGLGFQFGWDIGLAAAGAMLYVDLFITSGKEKA